MKYNYFIKHKIKRNPDTIIFEILTKNKNQFKMSLKWCLKIYKLWLYLQNYEHKYEGFFTNNVKKVVKH